MKAHRNSFDLSCFHAHIIGNLQRRAEGREKLAILNSENGNFMHQAFERTRRKTTDCNYSRLPSLRGRGRSFQMKVISCEKKKKDDDEKVLFKSKNSLLLPAFCFSLPISEYTSLILSSHITDLNFARFVNTRNNIYFSELRTTHITLYFEQ